MKIGRTFEKTIVPINSSYRDAAMFPAHETQMSGLSRYVIQIYFQRCMDDNFPIFDHLNVDGKNVLQAYNLEAILDASAENNISPIPRDVRIVIVKSGFIRGAMLKLQGWDTSIRASQRDDRFGNARERIFVDAHFGLLKVKRPSVFMV